MDARIFSHPPRSVDVFFRRIGKRPDLNIMIVSTFEFPGERQARLPFEEEGQDYSFYVQETAWHSTECEQCWKSWKEL